MERKAEREKKHTGPLAAKAVRAFQRQVLEYYQRHGRNLPWRTTRNSYRILVSEIMLQQTQVDRVIDKYLRFIELFPDLASLAEAPRQAVLAAWQGLGYNRRALALSRCANEVLASGRRTLPRTFDGLVQLPGIGPYTAAAVCVFAYNQPKVFIETNIRAVYLHSFFEAAREVCDDELMPYVRQTLYADDPRRWYNALMDYGTYLKKLFPNPSRKSAHHTRQSAFKGSDREIRGKVIRELLSVGALAETRLLRLLGPDRERAARIIDQLIREGFLKRTGQTIALR